MDLDATLLLTERAIFLQKFFQFTVLSFLQGASPLYLLTLDLSSSWMPMSESGQVIYGLKKVLAGYSADFYRDTALVKSQALLLGMSRCCLNVKTYGAAWPVLLSS